MRVLILCTGNSCRSQMAAGFLRQMRPHWQVVSAGTEPAAQVHPLAVKVMAEEGLDLSGEVPRQVAELTRESFDYVVTVCNQANKNCPTFAGEVRHREHIGFPDPALARGSDEELEAIFRQTRDGIRRWFAAFIGEVGEAP